MKPETLVTCPQCHTTGFTPRGLKAHRCDGVNRKADAPATLTRFGGQLTGRAPEGALTVADEDEDTTLGLQLELQWERAVGGQREQLIFGAMMLKLRANLSARGQVSKGGRGHKGEGLDGWLKTHAPNVTRGTAYRLMEIAEGVQDICKLGKTVDLAELLAASVEELPDKLAKKRKEVQRLIEGKSQRQLLLQFGEAKEKGGSRTRSEKAPALTPEEERAIFLGACREDFTACFTRLDALNVSHHWQAPTIADADLEAAIAAAEQFAREATAWLKTPQKKRSPLALPESEETAAAR